MSLEKQDVYDLIEEQEGWEVVEDFDTDEGWSLSASTEDGIRVSVEAEINEPKMNNLTVWSRFIELSSVDEYREAVEVASEDSMVQVIDNEDPFHRVKHSAEFEDPEDGVELLFDKEISVGIRFVAVDASQDVGFSAVPEMVSEVRSTIEEVSFFEVNK